MSRAHCLSLFVTMIVVLLLLMSLEVQAQDDAATCQSIKSQEAATIIRADIKLMNSAPCQPTCTNETETAREVKKIKEELEEMKKLLGYLKHFQQCSDNDVTKLCEYKTCSYVDALAYERFVI